MRPCPKVVAFDVIETVFSLDTLRKRLETMKVPGSALDVWFARLLRDAMALEITGLYRPFREIAAAGFSELLAEHGVLSNPSMVSNFLASFAELAPHPDAGAAFKHLRDKSIRVVALTNGGTETTTKLLQGAGLTDLVEQVISVEEVRHWKPSSAVYAHAVARAGVDRMHLALVAAHAWDIHGAGSAGLTTAYVDRGKPYSSAMLAPHISADSLLAAAIALGELPKYDN